MNRLSVILVYALVFSGCAAPGKMSGDAGPLRWAATEPTFDRADVGGKATEYYRTSVTIVTGGPAITFTRLQTTLYERGMDPLTQVREGQWRLLTDGKLELPLGFYLTCSHGGACLPHDQVAPAWRIRLTGRTDSGTLVDESFDVTMPTGAAPRARMP